MVIFIQIKLCRIFLLRQKQKWYQNTLFVLVGDHASGYGDEKTLDSIEKQARTFAILKHPSFKSKKIKHPTSHIDIPATIINLLGGQNKSSQGVSVFDKIALLFYIRTIREIHFFILSSQASGSYVSHIIFPPVSIFLRNKILVLSCKKILV